MRSNTERCTRACYEARIAQDSITLECVTSTILIAWRKTNKNNYKAQHTEQLHIKLQMVLRKFFTSPKQITALHQPEIQVAKKHLKALRTHCLVFLQNPPANQVKHCNDCMTSGNDMVLSFVEDRKMDSKELENSFKCTQTHKNTTHIYLTFTRSVLTVAHDTNTRHVLFRTAASYACRHDVTMCA